MGTFERLKVGRWERWKNGRLERWNVGTLERWKVRRWRLIKRRLGSRVGVSRTGGRWRTGSAANWVRGEPGSLSSNEEHEVGLRRLEEGLWEITCGGGG
ncbi:MAG TPA: hypothetical protein VFZ76_16560 [Anaerolineales bacterium]